MPRLLTALLLAALLLSPAAAPAQMPNPAKVPPRSISIQVTLVSAWVSDVDALGINFDLLPLSARHTFLTYATGNIVQQVYTTLTRRHGYAVSLVPIPASDGLPVTTAVDAKVPDYTASVEMSNGPPTVLSLLGYFQLQGSLTLTPHITPDNLVALDINSSNSKDKPSRFRAIPSGSCLVIAAPDVQGTDTPILGSAYRKRDSLPKTDELLIFITPTIAPAASVQAAPAQSPNPEKTVSLDVSRGDLHSVVALLETRLGIKAVVQDGSQPYRLINIHLQDASLSKALRCIAFSAGATETQNADGVYVFAPADAVNPPGTASQPHEQGAPTPLNAADLRWHTIILQHAHPADILNFMHWGDGSIIADTSNLPTGVAHIFALQSNNSLLVQATEEGYAQIKEIVSVLDIAPQRVQLKVTLAAIPLNAKSAIDLMDPDQALRQLQQAKAIFYELPPLTTNDGVAVQLPAIWPSPGLPLLANHPSNGDILALGLELTPHVNADSSITLKAESRVPMRVTAHTVLPGTIAAFEVTGLPQFNGYRVFLFVTPTILPPSTGNVGISIKP